MNLFFVYQGSLEVSLYIDRLSNLTGAQIVAAFPTRHQAVEYANKIKKFSTVVVERAFNMQNGDDNNLMSLLDWKTAQEPQEPQEPELPQLTGSVSIIGNAVIGETLTLESDGLSGNGLIHYQWERGGDDVNFTSIPSAVADYYVLTQDDFGKYISVGITRDGMDGVILAEAIGPVVP